MKKVKNTLRLLLALVLASGALSAAADPVVGGSATAGLETHPAAPTPSEPEPLEPVVRYDVRHDTSPALSSIQPIPPDAGPSVLALPRLPLSKTGDGSETAVPFDDPVLQDRSSTATLMPSPIRNFEGVNNRNGVVPPDTQGDVGPNHYVQWVNLSFAVWDKAGNLLYGPADGNTLWSGFGGPCETTNDGDPITLYDHLADRWLMSQFALPNYPDGPYYECIAISQTPDPTGSWHRYAFLASNTKMNDYPKFGVWPDGYYMTVNQFANGSSWGGAGVFAFERDKMLLGQSAQMVYFDLYNVDPDFGGMLPSDLDGFTPPPAGAPNYFVEVDDATWIPPVDALRLWEFHVDWTTTANSTFGLSGQPNGTVNVASFIPLCTSTINCIPQPGTSVGLDAIGDRLMFRLAYRNMGTHESLVVNHTVNAGAGRAGIRWYEVRDPGSTPVIYQQGTFAPADGLYRWMGSAAVDRLGNIAVGYSVSSSSVYPSIRYTGRLVDDPLGTMGQGEAEIIAGSGSQTSSYSRWGDYSMMGIDPVDDCTFWYTQEYVQTTGNAPWQTRIGSFRFSNCTPGGQGTIAGIVQDSATLDPIVGAQVRASFGPTQTFETTSGAGGSYTLTLASGTYTVTGSAYGYYLDETAGVSVSEGMTTSLDILLTPAPTYVVSGTVTDAVTGWPLYARIDVDGYGSRVVWNDPVTGFYSVTLAGETPYTFNVHGWANGYLPGVRSVGPLAADVTVNLALDADASACDAPGYVMGAECHPSPGGLVVGNVYDGHTGAPLVGAAVTNDSGDSATAAVTADPAVDDGFYTLFSPVGTHTVTATHYHYGPGVASPTVVQSDTVRQDLELPAGRLSYSPAGMAITLTWGASGTLPLTLTNVGDVAASFELVELEPAMGPVGPFQTPDAIVKPFKQSFSTTQRIKLPDLPAAPPYPAGAVIRSWPAGVQNGWGIALAPSRAGNGEAGAVWLASPSARWGGDNRFYEYTPDGTPMGRFYPFAWSPPFGPADGAVNWHTGMLWVMNIDSPGSNNCIYEVDPARGYTGDRICPAGNGFANSQRGLAYDPADDTWYAGGWNDRTIYHFDSAGTVLQSVDVGLGISGLAYNPDTRHLFVMTNDDASPVFVLDVAGGYAPIGRFSVGAGFGSYGGAGLEFDCAGNLWAVDQASDTVYQFASGEATALCQYDLPWLSADPITGAVGPASGQVVSVTFDAGQLDAPDWGVHYARLKIEHDTPYSLTNVPLTMTVEPPPPSLTITKTLAPDPAGIGIPLRYTVTVSNAGGPATGVTISDTLPADVQFVSASHGGVLVGEDVVWGGLSAAGVGSLSVAYTVTVDCVSPGTSIANVAYQVTATEWPTPVLGKPVTVTAVTPDVIAGFDFPTPVVRGNPVRFANLSQNSAVYEWDFGDGLTSTLLSPTHAYAAIGTYTVTLTARTLCDGSDQASQALAAHDYGGMIWPDAATGEADPGVPFTYTLQLTNTGTLSDSFDLSLGTHGWDTGLSSSRVGPLAPGEPGSFEVTVIAAPEALAGDWDRVIVTATAVSDPRAPRVATSSTLTTTANPVYDVTLFPAAGSRSGVPGTGVIYFLQAINTGNAGDAYTLSRLGGEWPISILPSGSFTLAASVQQAVLVQVTVPVTATAVEWDVSEVQVLAGSGVTSTSRLTTSVACVGSGGASFTYVPASPVASERVVFTGSVGIGTPPVTYTWDFGDGSLLLVRGGGAAGGEVFTHTYGTPGVYRAVMTATNCYGASISSAAHVVTVGGAPDITVQPASLAATLSPGQAGAVTLTIGNVGTADLSWTLAPVPVVGWLDVAKTGGDLPLLGSTDVAITFTAPPITAVLAYTTTLHISSNDPDRPHVTVPVTLTVVEGCEKIAGAGFTYRPAIPMVGQAVVLTGTAAAGTAHLPVTYTWDFGDGSPLLTVGIDAGTAGGSVVTHAFPLTTTVRVYTVTMGVANPCSDLQLVQKSVTVHPYRVLLPAILKEERTIGHVASASPPPPYSDMVLPAWFQIGYGPGSQAGTVSEPLQDDGIEGEGPWVVRAYYTDRRMAYDLAAWIEPWEVHHDQGYLVVDVTRAGYERLLRAGFRIEVDERLTALLNRPNVRSPGQVSGIPGYSCYRTVEETFDAAQAMVAAHPDLATWIDVGDSWEKTEPGGNPGYDLMVLRLTNAAIPGPKPKLFVMSSVHAREYTPAELNTRFAEYLVDNYGLDPDATWLLDHHEVHLLLQANPDGRKKAETGLSWRKNTNENYCSPTSNYRGADLNRNFEFQWGCCYGSSDKECDETYRGPSAASEPETQAIQDYVRSQFPDQRGVDLLAPAPVTATGVFLDVHSYSQLVLWPWGFTSATAPNSTGLQTLGRKLAYFNDYEPDQAVGLYPTDGTTDDFAYGELGLAAYTFELGTTFFQDCASFEDTILPDNLQSLIYAAKVSRAPYLTPSGPDALDVAVTPLGVTPGEPAQLTATIDDTRYNNQNGTEPTQAIATAEYYVDVPPWITTTTPVSYPMTATDGGFDGTAEAVEASVETAGLSAGRHTIFVRGRDAAGNWGALSAVFLSVLEAGVSPVIEGYVHEAHTDMPLEATVTAGTFQASSDPASGYYSMTVVSDTYSLGAVAPGHAISTVTSIVAADYQTVRQDFHLFPTCQILSDDVESGNLGWTAQSPWAIADEAAHSPSHSWTDSPGGSYSINRNVSLTSPVLDLSDYSGVMLSFWHTYDLEDGYDYGYVEYSTDGGTNWTMAASYNGQGHTTWTRAEVDVPALDHQPNGRVRFRLYSDGWVTGDGWHVDDIVLSGGGLACLQPAAGFTTSSPIYLGRPVTFTNRTKGAGPLGYWWDFGDGVGISTQRDPVYTYVSTGTFTVTLVATNSLGSDRASQPVTVLSPTSGLALAPITATQLGDLGASVTYTLFITNTGNVIDRYLLAASGNTWTATLSTDITGDVVPLEGTSVQVVVDVPLNASVGQTDTAAITAVSQGDSGVSASGVLTTTAVDICYPVAIAHLVSDAPVVVGETVHVTAVVIGDPHLPITYTWNWGDGTAPEIGVGLNAVSHTFGAADTYTVTLDVANGCPSSARAVLGVRVDLLYHGVALDPPAGARSGIPGTTVAYTLAVHNLGTVQDSFGVSLSRNAWDVTSDTGTIGPLAAGAAGALVITVAIPVTATDGMTDTVDVRITSVGEPGESSSSRLTTTARWNRLYLPLLMSGGSGTLVGPQPDVDGKDRISPWVLAATADGARTDFMVVLAEQADLSPAYDLPTKQARGRWVYETLWETAQRNQAPVRAWLDARGVAYRPFYVVNALHVLAGDRALAEKLAARRDVARIEANPRIQNLLPESVLPETGFFPNEPVSPDTVEWNILKVNAPDVWAMGYTGQGVVVGGQDTGYDWDHPALKDQYRGWDGASVDHDYNWHDAVAGSSQPVDPHSHGTHTMGIVVGDDGGSNQIGMAPGARWMGCRNMDSGGYGTPATYLACFEFFLAPYPVGGDPGQGDPDRAPDVTNNSWSCPPSEGCSWSTLQAAVEAQRAADILTVVSAGNGGSACSTVREPPALYDAAYTVGATGSSDGIASFSSRGPVTVDGSDRLKPDISAPGAGIRSCMPGTGYGYKSGTSMAAPHVAGAVALLWSAQPALRDQIDQTEQILNVTALARYSTQCGGLPDTVPNNVYGWGRLDALAAVRQVLPPPELTVVKMPAGERVGVGALLRYTITVSNAGGPATGVTIRDTLPSDTEFAWADDGGVLAGDDVAWSGWSVPASGTIAVHYAATVTCVPSGTRLPNATYYVTATEWPTPTFGPPVTVTAVAEDVSASFVVSTSVLLNWPLAFTNLSQNGVTFEWDFGDGFTSTLSDPAHVYTDVGTYTATLTARNICTSDTYRRSLTVKDYALDLVPRAQEGWGAPGRTATYTLRVTNTGTLTSAFGLRIGDHVWPTELSTDIVGPLSPGASVPLQVYVTVKAEAGGGDSDAVVITAAPTSDPRNPPTRASSTITTVANPTYGVALEPAAASQTAPPGQAVTYTLGMTNTGSVTDVFTLTLSGHAWTTTVSMVGGTAMLPTIGPLDAGEWAVLVVETEVPFGALGGDSDAVAVTVTSRGDDTASATTVLTTTAAQPAATFEIYLPVILRGDGMAVFALSFRRPG